MKSIAVLVFLLASVAGCGSAARTERAPAGPAPARAREPLGLAGYDDVWVVETRAEAKDGEISCGRLRTTVDGKTLALPLVKTDVKARATVHVGSVGVVQRYRNPFGRKIEAVYTFPLPHNAAVADFVLVVGERRIRGIVREREEAEEIYEQARRQGHRAALLAQERPNVFEQSVANIEPGETLDVAITYFQPLAWRRGGYEFVLPTVVGRRFDPRGVDVPYLPKGADAPHRVFVNLRLDAGALLRSVACPSHPRDAAVERLGTREAVVQLSGVPADRDVVVRWKIEEAPGALTVHGEYFSLVLWPPADAPDAPAPPREMVFVVDASGSMRGEPLAACKRTIRRCLGRLRRGDTFRIVNFSNVAGATETMPATRASLRRGERYLDGLQGGGGTRMIEGVRAALEPAADPERRRIVAFMTDGFIGNEREILSEVHRLARDARIFSFGVGSSVNRYLLEAMARAGRGVAAYVTLDASGQATADRLFRRLERPLVESPRVDFGALDATDVYPTRVPDLFPDRPVVLYGRLRGRRGSIAVPGLGSWTVDVDEAPEEPVLGRLWARAAITELADRRVREPEEEAGLRARIRDLALDHGLASSETSFVAVDAAEKTAGTKGLIVPIAVPVPTGSH